MSTFDRYGKLFITRLRALHLTGVTRADGLFWRRPSLCVDPMAHVLPGFCPIWAAWAVQAHGLLLAETRCNRAVQVSVDLLT
jgi:hypothetical protein